MSLWAVFYTNFDLSLVLEDVWDTKEAAEERVKELQKKNEKDKYIVAQTTLNNGGPNKFQTTLTEELDEAKEQRKFWHQCWEIACNELDELKKLPEQIALQKKKDDLQRKWNTYLDEQRKREEQLKTLLTYACGLMEVRPTF